MRRNTSGRKACDAKLKTMSTNEIDEALCEKALRETSRACVRINLFEDYYFLLTRWYGENVDE